VFLCFNSNCIWNYVQILGKIKSDIGENMRVIALLGVCFLIAGCSTTANTPTNSQYLGAGKSSPATKINSGMNLNDVETLIGKPSGIRTNIYRSTHYCRAYSYPVGSLERYLHVEYDNDTVIGFNDGRLTSLCQVSPTAQDFAKHAKDIAKN